MRTIREEETYERCCQELGDRRRLDDQLESVMWLLGADAEWGEEVPGTRLRIILTQDFSNSPSYRVYYTIDDADYCTLLWIEEAEPAAEEDISG